MNPMKAHKESIVAVVVTFNRLKKLRVVVERLLSEPIEKIVVVDNASKDGTKEYLETIRSSRIHTLFLDTNSGGAGGFCAGIRYVHEEIGAYAWIVVMDDDAYPVKGAIDTFLQTVEPRMDAVCAAVYYPNGEICDMNRPGIHPFASIKQSFRTLISASAGFHLGDEKYKQQGAQRVHFGSFVGLFVRKRVVDRIGYPDSAWFIYGDDLDYTLRLSERGYELCFLPQVKFVHDCMTTGINEKVYRPLWKAFFTYRNGLMIYRRLSGRLYPLVVLQKSLLWLYRTRYYQDKQNYLRYTFWAIVDGLRRDRKRTLHDLERF